MADTLEAEFLPILENKNNNLYIVSIESLCTQKYLYLPFRIPRRSDNYYSAYHFRCKADGEEIGFSFIR